jgi:hypothetical protein
LIVQLSARDLKRDPALHRIDLILKLSHVRATHTAELAMLALIKKVRVPVRVPDFFRRVVLAMTSIDIGMPGQDVVGDALVRAVNNANRNSSFVEVESESETLTETETESEAPPVKKPVATTLAPVVTAAPVAIATVAPQTQVSLYLPFILCSCCSSPPSILHHTVVFVICSFICR